MRNKIVELSMKEFLIFILRRWLLILLCGVLFAGVIGVQEYSKQKAAETELQSRYERQLSAYKQSIQAKELELRNLTKKMNASIEHNENSILLNIDPIYGPTANLTFSIKALLGLDKTENVVGDGEILGNTLKIVNENVVDINGSIAHVYLVLLNSTNLPEVLKTVLPQTYEQKYLEEIVRSEKISDSLIRITAVGNEDIQPEVLVQALYDYIASQQQVVADAVAAHELTLLDVSLTPKMDLKFEEELEKSRDTMAEYSEVVKKLQENIDKEKKDKPAKPVFASRVAKDSLIGFLSGLILASITSVIFYAVTLRIQTTEQIQRQLDMRYLGGGLHKRGILFGILADKLSGTIKLAKDPEVTQYVGFNLKELTSGIYKNILLTGTLSQADLEEFEQLIKHRFETEQEIQFLIGANVSQSASSLKKLEEAEAILLVERIDFSKLKIVNLEIERIRLSGKNILGYVLY